jgi:enoyl-CoA hydratase
MLTSIKKGWNIMIYNTILLTKKQNVWVLTLNRPKALNALSEELTGELKQAVSLFEETTDAKVLVITGSERAFAAGADIKEMQHKKFPDVYHNDFIGPWEAVARCKKPIIAAVSGYALGGGCELAMMCDFIIASDTAQFAQPEVTIGTIPGAGGTQRLTKLVGKSKAMDMCLTGRMMDANEAERAGLVSRIVPANELLEETLKIAEKIAALPETAVRMIKEAVNAAQELSLAEGIRLERRLFQSTFATADRLEGMTAFVEKRQPQFGS